MAVCRQERPALLRGRLLRPRPARALPLVSLRAPCPRVDGRLRHSRAARAREPAPLPVGPRREGGKRTGGPHDRGGARALSAGQRAPKQPRRPCALDLRALRVHGGTAHARQTTRARLGAPRTAAALRGRALPGLGGALQPAAGAGRLARADAARRRPQGIAPESLAGALGRAQLGRLLEPGG